MYPPTHSPHPHWWYLPAIIWSNPTGRAICSWFQFPHTHRGMCALKSLIEMDWVIQLTLTHLGVLCVVEAFALGYCHKSLSHHRTSTPVLTVFIKLNWIELFFNQKAVFFFFIPFAFFFQPFHSDAVRIHMLTCDEMGRECKLRRIRQDNEAHVHQDCSFENFVGNFHSRLLFKWMLWSAFKWVWFLLLTIQAVRRPLPWPECFQQFNNRHWSQKIH